MMTQRHRWAIMMAARRNRTDVFGYLAGSGHIDSIHGVCGASYWRTVHRSSQQNNYRKWWRAMMVMMMAMKVDGTRVVHITVPLADRLRLMAGMLSIFMVSCPGRNRCPATTNGGSISSPCLYTQPSYARHFRLLDDRDAWERVRHPRGFRRGGLRSRSRNVR